MQIMAISVQQLELVALLCFRQVQVDARLFIIKHSKKNLRANRSARARAIIDRLHRDAINIFIVPSGTN